MVILLLIQIGGLGYMTISTVLAAALGRNISLQERLTLQTALNVDSLEGLVRFAGVVLKVTLAFELAGAAILAVRWWQDLGPAAVWYGLFHSVSAFNNAGFAPHGGRGRGLGDKHRARARRRHPARRRPVAARQQNEKLGQLEATLKRAAT